MHKAAVSRFLIPLLLSFPIAAAPSAAQLQQTASSALVSGAERLAWDQPRSEYDHVADFQFVVYVDGVAQSVAEVICVTSAADAYSCSSALPQLTVGTHVIEVAAVVSGRTTERSDAIQVTSVTVSQTEIRTSGSSSRASTCGTGTSTACTSVETVAKFSEPITAMAPVSDDRLYLVEAGRTIRVLVGSKLLSQAAFRVDRVTDRIIALAADPGFAKTRAVWVAWLDESVPASRTLSVARYRDVNNQLGEQSVVVDALSIPSALDPVVALDTSNQIYIAVPSEDAAADPYGGFLLRFGPDGTVTAVSGQSSPRLAAGYDRPTAIASDDASGRIWLAGRDEGGQARLGWIATTPAGATSAVTDASVMTASIPEGADVTSLAIVSGTSGISDVYMVDSEGEVLRATFPSPSGAASLAAGTIANGDETAVLLASRSSGILFVVVQPNPQSSEFVLRKVSK